MLPAKTIPAALPAAALMILIGCDEPQGRPPWHGLQAGPEDDGLVLADRAFLVDAEPGPELSVAPDELVFHGATVHEDDDWQPGDLLVNGAGTGFLRRVVDVQATGGDTVVATEEAELHELIAQGSL